MSLVTTLLKLEADEAGTVYAPESLRLPRCWPQLIHCVVQGQGGHAGVFLFAVFLAISGFAFPFSWEGVRVVKTGVCLRSLMSLSRRTTNRAQLGSRTMMHDVRCRTIEPIPTPSDPALRAPLV